MYNQDFEDYFKLFDWERNAQGELHAPEWALYRTEGAVRLVKERAASFQAVPSISLFIRSFESLKRDGSLKQVRQSDPLLAAYEPDEEELTAAIYYKMPAAEIISRYRVPGSPFRAAVDKLIQQGLIVLLLGLLPCVRW